MLTVRKEINQETMPFMRWEDRGAAAMKKRKKTKQILDYCPNCKAETVKEILIDYRHVNKQPIIYLCCANCRRRRYVKVEQVA
jgi:transcription elongation factor Elf1